MGEKWVETHFSPTSNPFRDFRENRLFSQFKGVGNCFLKRALKQSRPSISEGSLLHPARDRGSNLDWAAKASGSSTRK